MVTRYYMYINWYLNSTCINIVTYNIVLLIPIEKKNAGFHTKAVQLFIVHFVIYKNFSIFITFIFYQSLWENIFV